MTKPVTRDDVTMVRGEACQDCLSRKCECPTGTDPYGHISYALSDPKGNGDLICFDYAINERKTLARIHSVIDCETAHFLEDFANVVVPIDEGMGAAVRQIDAATMWFFDNDYRGYVGIRSIRRFLKHLAHDLGGKEIPDVHLRSR